MTDKETIFNRAFEIEDADERQRYLDSACGQDQELRHEIESLLALVGSSEEDSLDSPLSSLTRFEEMAAAASGFDDHNIPNFELIRRLGEGGFGVVYLAEQKKPVKRKVAIKVVKPGMQSEQVIARFEAERQLLAMMEHDGIARVYDAGTTDKELPYFVMELVEGQPITHFADEHKLSTEQRLRLFVDVCEAVQHAHRKGIIHRDIKPSNVMVAMQDGNPTVKVIDFGIAKALNEKVTERTLLTAQNQLIGTPQYMSPEQAELSDLEIDTRSDIYSLGVLLYELLTGTTPLTKEQVCDISLLQLQKLICEEDVPRPSDRISKLGEKSETIASDRGVDAKGLRSNLKGELDWIVRKSLEKERDRRYETPISLATDVRRHLNGEAVEACPPTWSYLASKFVKKNLVAVAASTLLATLAVVGLSVFSFVTSLRRSNEIMRSQAVIDDANGIMQSNGLHSRSAAFALLHESVNLAPSQNMRRINQTVMSGIGNFMGLAPIVVKPTDGELFFAAFAFDAEANRLFAGTQAGKVLIYNLENGVPTRSIDLPDETAVRAIHAHKPNSSTESTVIRALCTSGNLWEITDQANAVATRKIELPIKPNRSAHFTPDGRKLAANSDDEAVLCDLERLTTRQIDLPANVRKLRDITLSHDQDLLAIGFSPNDQDCGAIVLNADSFEIEKTIDGNGGTFLRNLDFDSTGSRFVFGNVNSTVHTMQDFSQVYSLLPSEPYTVAFRPGFHHLGILYSSEFQYLDSRTRDELYRFPVEFDFDKDTTLVFAPFGDKMLLASSKEAQIFDLRTKKSERLELPGHDGGVSDLRFSPDGKSIASCGGDGKVQLWNAETGGVVWSVENERELPVQNVCFSPDGNLIAFSHKEGSSPIEFIRAETGSISGKIEDCGHGPVNGIALVEANSKLSLAVASGDSKDENKIPGRLALWDLVPSAEKFVLRPREEAYVGNCRDLKCNESTIAWIDHKTIRLLDLATNQTNELTEYLSADEALVFTKRNQLSFLGETNQYEVWNKESRRWTRLENEDEELKNTHKANLSFDGQLQSVRLSSRQLEIRNTGLGEKSNSATVPIVKLPPVRTEIWSVDWHPTAYTIAIGDASGAITIWRLAEVNRIMKEAKLRPFIPTVPE